MSLLVFSLLYTPCVAAIAAVRRELGRKWALVVVLWQCFIAWVAALIVRLFTLSSTVTVAVIVGLVVAAVIAKLITDKVRGKNKCGECSSCIYGSTCGKQR